MKGRSSRGLEKSGMLRKAVKEKREQEPKVLPGRMAAKVQRGVQTWGVCEQGAGNRTGRRKELSTALGWPGVSHTAAPFPNKQKKRTQGA